MKSDAMKIYELYAESADANEQPQMVVDRNDTKAWYLHGRLHRKDGPVIERANGGREWHLHGKLHREDAPAVEYANGNKEWWLHGKHYATADAWAEAVLKMRNKPHDAEAVQKFVRAILTKDDLL